MSFCDYTLPFYFEMYCSHLASHEEVQYSCMIDTDCMMEDKKYINIYIDSEDLVL